MLCRFPLAALIALSFSVGASSAIEPMIPNTDVSSICGSVADHFKWALGKRLEGGLVHETLREVTKTYSGDEAEFVQLIVLEAEQIRIPTGVRTELEKKQFLAQSVGEVFLGCVKRGMEQSKEVKRPSIP